MLHSETYWHVPQLALFSGQAEGAASAEPVPEESLPVPAEMLELFEQMTGWLIEFEETRSSYKKRQLPTLTPHTASGAFSIVDMSANWPADRPTAHRAKCDRFVQHLANLVSELHRTKAQLVKTQSTIAAYCPLAVQDNDVELVDSFIPRYDDQRKTDRRIADRRKAGRTVSVTQSDFDLNSSDFELANLEELIHDVADIFSDDRSQTDLSERPSNGAAE